MAISWPILIAPFLSNITDVTLTSSLIGLTALRSQLNISRRLIRLFRFLDSFHAGYQLYTAEEKGLETWLIILSKSLLGIYGFLETATMLDILNVDELGIFGKERSRELNLQAQVFWFTALYASVISSGIKLFQLFAHRAVPKTGEGYGTGEKPVEKTTESEKAASKETPVVVEKALSEEERLKNEQERLKGVVAQRKEERTIWTKEFSAQATTLGKKMLSETLDMLLPSAGLGWVKVDPGLVGLAMFCTTIITGLDVWHKIGRDLEKKKA